MATQLQSNYPLVIIEKTADPLSYPQIYNININPLEIETLVLRKGSYYPIATFETFSEIDPLSSILSILSKSSPDVFAIIQFALEATDSSWQQKGANFAEKGVKNDDGSYSPRSDKNIINEKFLIQVLRLL